MERKAGGDSVIELWSSLDALVLKATALVLHQHLKPPLIPLLPPGRKLILFEMLADHIKDIRVLDLLWNYIYHTVYDGGYYKDICRGICRGCPLSPLIGTLYLKQLDDRMARTGLFYARFMDDVVILAPTRWKLRAAIKKVNQTFTPSRLGVAPKTFERFVERMTRLYEQGAGAVRIGEYALRWWRWVRAGLGVKIMGEVELNFTIGSYCSFNHKGPLRGRRPSDGLRNHCTIQSFALCPCTNALTKTYLVTKWTSQICQYQQYIANFTNLLMDVPLLPRFFPLSLQGGGCPIVSCTHWQASAPVLVSLFVRLPHQGKGAALVEIGDGWAEGFREWTPRR